MDLSGKEKELRKEMIVTCSNKKCPKYKQRMSFKNYIDHKNICKEKLI